MTRNDQIERSLHPLRVATFLLVAMGVPTGGLAQEAKPFAPLPVANEVNADRAELGRLLFFDSRLSGDTSTSCATCHDPAKGWGDGKALSDGYSSVSYFRNAPGLFNVANRNYLMWDARLDGADLGTLVRDMITESHTMNMDSRLMQERLKQVPEYVTMFEKAFGGDPYGGKIYSAVAEYLKTIRTQNAPFDAYLNGKEDAISDSAKRGMELFAGKAGCAQCHSGAILSDGAVYATGAPDHPDLQSDANRQISLLRHYSTQGTPNYMNLRQDVGNYVVTKEKGDIGKFATPSLWDAGQTAPYMHSGAFATLAEVIEFYDAGGGDGANKSGMLKPLGLTADEKADLLSFLQSLTGDAPDANAPDLPDYALREVGKN